MKKVLRQTVIIIYPLHWYRHFQVLENIFARKLFGFGFVNNILILHQSGFTKNRSTTDAANALISAIVRDMESRNMRRRIFIDLAIAFDLVKHDPW